VSNFERTAVKYQIYRNGGLVTNNSIEVVRIFESANATQLDTAELWLDSGYSGQYVFALSEPPLMGDEIEIVDPSNGAVVHWGKITTVRPELSPKGEGFHLVSRTEMFHLGGRVDGYFTWSPFNDAPWHVDHPMIFNPVIDGKVIGNSHSSRGLGVGDAIVFLDPESCRTEKSRELQAGVNTTWTLSEAINYLLWSLNENQLYISNPPRESYDALFDPVNSQFNAVHVPNNRYLAQALDDILIPLGFNWRVKRNGIGDREFSFFARGTGGDLVSVYLQEANAELDLTQTNIEACTVGFDTSRLANSVVVRGGFKEYEITQELGRCWPQDQDNLSDDELSTKVDNFEEVRNVYRKWVWNEAGDYNDLRPEFGGPILVDSALNVNLGDPPFNQLIDTPRRRRFLPCLTLRESEDDTGLEPIGSVHGVEIKYLNPLYDPEADPQVEPLYLPAGNWGIEILENECGIYIGQERVPEEILSQGTAAKLFATFTYRTDQRLEGYAPYIVGNSPQVDLAPVVIDLPDRFQYRKVTENSHYYGEVVEEPTRQSLQRDDSAAIQAYAEHLQRAFNLMEVGGRIVLEGLDHNYEVGQRVSGIVGREVSFAASPVTESYPQIVAIERDAQSQAMTLHLQRVNGLLQS